MYRVIALLFFALGAVSHGEGRRGRRSDPVSSSPCAQISSILSKISANTTGQSCIFLLAVGASVCWNMMRA